MTSPQVSWLVLLVLATASPAQEAKPAEKGVDQQTIGYYARFGATYGGWMRDEFGGFRFEEGRRAAEKGLPKFYLPWENMRKGLKFRDLDVPFGLEFSIVPDNPWLKELGSLKNLSAISVWRSNVHIEDTWLKELAPGENLATVKLGRMTLTDTGMKELARLKNLTTLELAGTVITEAAFKELPRLKNLTVLRLELEASDAVRTDLWPKNCSLKILAELPKLSTLHLGGPTFTDDSLKGLSSLKNLSRLSLLGTKATEAGLKELAELPNLTALCLGGGHMTDDGLKQVSALKNLTRLRLQGNNFGTRLTAAGVGHLAGLKKLTRIELLGTAMRDTVFKELANVENLTELDMTTDQSSQINGGLKGLDGFRKLSKLNLSGHWMPGDTVLRQFAGLENLTELDLSNAVLTLDNPGLKDLGGLTKLSRLILRSTGVKDAMLKDLAKLTNLTELDLGGTRVTSAGLKELAGFKKLTKLKLGPNYGIRDAGLKDLSTLVNLTELDLGDTGVSDVGLKDLAGLTSLRQLDLGRARVSLLGLNELAGLPNLSRLYVNGAHIDDPGMAEFRKAQVEEKRRAGRGIKPSTVLAYQQLGGSYGGWVKHKSGRLGFEQGKEQAEKGLPGFLFKSEPLTLLPDVASPFALAFEGVPLSVRGLYKVAPLKSLTWLDLNGTTVQDPMLKQLAGLNNLSVLYLGGTKVTDQGLKDLANLERLAELDLSSTQVTDAGLKVLASLKNLSKLELAETQVTDAGLKELAGLKNLSLLDLGGTKVADAGLKELAGLNGLTNLHLGGTQVTDAGLKELGGLKKLSALNLSGTKVTDAGVAELRKRFPNARSSDEFARKEHRDEDVSGASGSCAEEKRVARQDNVR